MASKCHYIQPVDAIFTYLTDTFDASLSGWKTVLLIQVFCKQITWLIESSDNNNQKTTYQLDSKTLGNQRRAEGDLQNPKWICPLMNNTNDGYLLLVNKRTKLVTSARHKTRSLERHLMRLNLHMNGHHDCEIFHQRRAFTDRQLISKNKHP